MILGLDVNGGDFAPGSTIKGALKALPILRKEDIQIALIGDTSAFLPVLKENGGKEEDFLIIDAPEQIGMNEHPTKAFSKKKNSSIFIGFHLLKEKKINAFASAGNTGAMLVGSMFTIRAIPGIIRPCITSILPKESGGVNIILDVGANADCKPDVLYQFGILGSLFAEFVYNIKNPKVGLLNIGEEEEKGNLLTQATYPLMKESSDFNFIGNVEGRDIFGDKVDVIVCDGFTGNVVLKEAEAFYTLVKRRGLEDDYFERFNYEIYGGTPILGVNAPVIIGHGISSPEAIKNMLLLSRDTVLANLSEKIKNLISNE